MLLAKCQVFGHISQAGRGEVRVHVIKQLPTSKEQHCGMNYMIDYTCMQPNLDNSLGEILESVFLPDL